MIKHLFADMDGTICNSKQVISAEMIKALNSSGKDAIIISGQDSAHMNHQLAGLLCTQMPQSGNITSMWMNSLSKTDIVEIYAYIAKLKIYFKQYFNWKQSDYIDNRGCQVSLSFMGHTASYEEKIGFDPDQKKRKEVLKKVPFIVKGLDCKIAGTTCLDYTKTDGKKGNNIQKYIDYMKWNKDECIYFGDALFKGGNDESVIGVIDTVEVSGPDDLIVKLQNYV